MPTARGYLDVATLDGLLYAIGGYDDGADYFYYYFLLILLLRLRLRLRLPRLLLLLI